MPRPELLLPAGDSEKLKTALLFGADSVYLGGKEFSLRAYAGNFTLEEIRTGLDFARALKKKVIIAANVIAHNKELADIPAYFEKLAALKPAFKKDGSVTAGNASGINDGAAGFIVMSKEKADELGIKPLAKIVSYASGGVDPKIMGIGPAFAMPKALKRAGLKMTDMDVIELNEAFAAQVIACVKELESQGHAIDPEKLNPNGGAIAFGHPNGMSGTRIAIFAMNELKRRAGRYAICSLCIGGGQGLATIFERLG